MNPERLLERFLRYVAIDTTADPAAEVYPSSAGQWTLGKLLVEELREIGLEDAEQDEHGLIWATLPAAGSSAAATMAWNSHMDTSPETSGANIQPQVLRDYAGGDIPLPGDSGKVIRVAENPELQHLHGRTLITTDGTTLLGADDKAGVAVIVEACAQLVEHPEIAHGPIKILFTCDEEIGHGVMHVDLRKLNAQGGYTLDGAGAGVIDVETFNAQQAKVTVRGVNIHPSIAKDRMVNAVRAAAVFIDKMPRDRMAPESTDGRDGFLHPYNLCGGVEETTIEILLRDFDTANIQQQADLLRRLAQQVEQECPGVSVDVDIHQQYSNMGDGLTACPQIVERAEEAFKRLGRPYKKDIVRGGTDGSLLTEQGLPTPNLSTGQHNPHSPLEWACLEEMVEAVEVLVELAKIWGEV